MVCIRFNVLSNSFNQFNLPTTNLGTPTHYVRRVDEALRLDTRAEAQSEQERP
jgi:hypothetical protein